MLKQSAAAILVCGDAGIEKNESWLLQNCSASIQNILLAAHGLGIGSCWIAIHGMDDVYAKIKTQFKSAGKYCSCFLNFSRLSG